MGQRIEAKLLFLFEDEIRAAAVAMERFAKISKIPKEQINDEEYRVSLTDTLQACHSAIHGAEDTSLSLVLCRKDIFGKRKEAAK